MNTLNNISCSCGYIGETLVGGDCARCHAQDDYTPLYVEYVGEAAGEPEFVIQGKVFQYVRAKYPDGKIDLGIYDRSQDRVMAYFPGRKLLGIDQ